MRRTALILAGVLALAACERGTEPFAPRTAAPAAVQPALSIVDGGHAGNPHFYFLPPLVSPPGKFTGAFDPSASPTLEIRCTAESCGGFTPVAYTPASGPGGARIQRNGGQQEYDVAWFVDPAVYTPGATYRLRVLLSSGSASVELGHVDAVVVSSANQGRGVDPKQFAVVVLGQQVPVRFRIEQGAVTFMPALTSSPTPVTLSSSGGEVASSDGSLALTVPAGAVSSTTQITVATTSSSTLPGSLEDASIASAVYQFGPSGLTFMQPITVTIKYNPDATPGRLRLYMTNGTGPWRVLANTGLNTADGTISASLPHFTDVTAMNGATGLTVTPSSASMGVGGTQQFSAVEYDTAGNVLSRTPQWSSSDTSVATVDTAGVVTALAPGNAIIYGTDGASDSASVSVSPWRLMAGSQASARSIWASSTSDVYAAGNYLSHFDGASWQTVSSYGSWLVWGSSSSAVFAADDSAGTLWRGSGSSWTPACSLPSSELGLSDMWGSSSSDIYLTSFFGNLLHYDGTSCSPVSGAVSGWLSSVWASSATSVFVGNGNGVLFHFDGSTWTQTVNPSSSGINALWGTGTHVFVAADSAVFDYSASAQTWTTVATPSISSVAGGVWGTSASNWFYSDGCYVAHWNGSTWSATPVVDAAGQCRWVISLSGVASGGSTTVYAGTDGGVYTATF